MSSEQDDHRAESQEYYYWDYADCPYEYLYNKVGHHQTNGDLPTQDLPIVNFKEAPLWDPPSALKICENFWFTNYDHKKFPRQAYLRNGVYSWVIWFVTDGRIRIDKNRNFWYFQGTGKTVLGDKIHQIKSSTKNNWRKIDIPNGIFQITELCNEVKYTLTQQLKQFSKNNPKSRIGKALYENLAECPDIVATQRDRNNTHRNNIWRFQPACQGGNRGNAKRAPAQENKVASVHKFLQEYHTVFCPRFKKK